MKKELLSEQIRTLADTTGIDALGFAEASEFAGYALPHSRRRDPKLSLPDAKTIIVAGIYIGGLTLPAWKDPRYGRTSRLYLSQFFLDVVKPLDPIVILLENQGHKAMVCDGSKEDGSTLPLKLAAVRAGLGWQGKHTLLVSKKYGTFLALGGIITDAILDCNTGHEPDRCGTCNRCQQACPLGTLDRPYVLDRGSCLSYLLQTGHLPDKARAVMGNRVGDCEICQEACPWNRKHIDQPLRTKLTETFREKTAYLEKLFYLPGLAELSEDDYGETIGFLNTGISYDLFHRNVMIAMERAQR